MDVSDDRVHGTQEQAFFNGYYKHECYAPLFIFCGRHLLAAKLRPSNVDPAAGATFDLPKLAHPYFGSFVGVTSLSVDGWASLGKVVAGALAELQRIIAQMRTQWPEVVIVVRGDSAYGREDIMGWCETPAITLPKSTHPSTHQLVTPTDNPKYGWVDLGPGQTSPNQTWSMC